MKHMEYYSYRPKKLKDEDSNGHFKCSNEIANEKEGSLTVYSLLSTGKYIDL